MKSVSSQEILDMKLFKSSILLTGVTVLALAFSSCDNIPEDKRFQDYTARIEKTSLVVEFSGVKCVNCPRGAEVLHKMIEDYKDNVVVVSMHPTGIMFTNPLRGTDLRSAAATDYWESSGKPSGLPCAIVDGSELSASTAQWTSLLVASLKNPSPLSISLTTSYDATESKVKAQYSIIFTSQYNAPIYKDRDTSDLTVALWLTQSGILGAQLDGNKTLEDYTHNHVMRAAFNDKLFGESIGSKFTVDQIINGDAEIVLSDKVLVVNDKNKEIRPENCEVVLVVFDAAHKVVQAAKCKVTNPAK